MLAKDPAERPTMQKVAAQLEALGARRAGREGAAAAPRAQRFLTVLASYVGFSFSLWQCVDAAANRYQLSPAGPTFCLYGRLRLLPGAARVGALWGEPWHGRPARVRALGLGANLLVAAGVLVLLARGRAGVPARSPDPPAQAMGALALNAGATP